MCCRLASRALSRLPCMYKLRLPRQANGLSCSIQAEIANRSLFQKESGSVVVAINTEEGIKKSRRSRAMCYGIRIGHDYIIL